MKNASLVHLRAAAVEARHKGPETLEEALQHPEVSSNRDSANRQCDIQLPPDTVLPLFLRGDGDKHIGYKIACYL